MADNDNRLDVLNALHLSETTSQFVTKLNENFEELDNREIDTQAALGNKVDKVAGKGLSTEDYTTAEKTKLGSIQDWALQANKPSYTANEVGAIATTAKGVANGVAELDANGKVPSAQLPSYVDDVVEYASVSSFPATGESGKIYVAIDTNKTYRWTGSQYTEISESLALGETSSTAYAGDKGKIAYDHATESNKVSSAVASGLYKVGVTSEGHIASTSAVQKTDLDSIIGVATAGGSGLSAFAVGDTVVDGDKIHFDTTKGSELATYLANTSYSEGEKVLFTGNDGDKTELTLIAFNFAQLGGSGQVILIQEQIVYATPNTEMEGEPVPAGFQNLDANGDFQVSLDNDISISAIYDTTPATWNGVIIGKEGGAVSGTDGLMSSTDKGKLDGISAGANKVEASQTNGNIKIDGVETTVYTLPAIDQVTEYSFTSDDARWGALSSGVYTLTIPSTKRPFICYNGDGEQVMATIGYNGTNITVKTDTKFAGKVLAI